MNSFQPFSGQTGIVQGFTTPSQTRVEVIGDSTDDYAIAVMIEGKSEALWFAENVLEFLGSSTRNDCGSWPSSLDS